MSDFHDDGSSSSDMRSRPNDCFEGRSSDASYHSHHYNKGNNSEHHGYYHSKGSGFPAHHDDSHFSRHGSRDSDRYSDDRARLDEGFVRGDRDRCNETRDRHGSRKPRDRYSEDRDYYGRDDYFDRDGFGGKGGGDYKNVDRHHDYHYSSRSIRKKPAVYDDLDFPSSILCLSNISVDTNEDRVCDSLKVFGPVEEVKRIFENDRPQDKVAVHFSSLNQATSMFNTLNSANLSFDISGQVPKISYYHPPHNGHHSESKRERSTYRHNTWTCLNCNADNFSHRETCFSCGVFRKGKFASGGNNNNQSSYGDAQDNNSTESGWKGSASGHQEYPLPAATKPPQTETKILVRGLPRDYVDGEMEKIVYHILDIPNYIKIFTSVHVSREHVSNACSGYAILNFFDVQFAEGLMNKTSGKINLNGDVLTLVVSTSSTGKESAGSSGVNRWSAQSPDRTLGGHQATSSAEESHSGASAVDYALKLPESWNGPTPLGPHGSDFVYEKETGCLLETKSGLYFEPNSGLFFNSTLGQYFYFDAASDSFRPWNGFCGQLMPSAKDADKDTPSAETKLPSASSLVASSENQPLAESEVADESSSKVHHLVLDQTSTRPSSEVPLPPTSVSFNLKANLSSKPIFSTPKVAAIFAKNRDPLLTSRSSRPPSPPRRYFPSTASRSSVAASAPPAPSSSPPIRAPERQQQVYTRGTICLICKRQLNSVELLERHIRESELHKKNLAALQPSLNVVEPVPLKPELFSKPPSSSLESSNLAAHASSCSSQEDDLTQLEEPQLFRPASPPLDDIKESIGLRMMQKMGYTGGGLGKKESGTVNPMQVSRRCDKSGLSNGEGVEKQSSKVDSYAQAAKRTFQARWEEIQREKRNK